MTTKRNPSSTLHVVCCCCAIGLALPSSAGASPGPSSTQDAELERRRIELDARANASYTAGAYKTAANLFEEAYELTSDANYLYNVSVCYDRVGELDKALVALDAFAAQSPDFDRKTIEAKRQSLMIRIEKATRADEQPASQPDEQPRRQSFGTRQKQPADQRSSGSKQLIIGGSVSLAVGIAGLATGIGLAVASAREDEAFAESCVELQSGLICPGSSQRDGDRARNLAIGADVSFAVGGVLAAGGIIMLAVNTALAKKRGKTTIALIPTISPHWAGASWTRRF